MKFLFPALLIPIFGFGQYEKSNPKVLVTPAIQPAAYAFNLKDVRLLNSPFRHAMDLDSGYLLSLSADRLLHRFFENAGLPPKAAVYGGWESEGLSGHTLGHYLSACSMMYASTGAPSFAQRVRYITGQLDVCQKARGTGYVGAIPHEDSIWAQVARGDIRSSGFDLNGGWSPWYTVHKLMAGLMDAYLYVDDTLALGIACRLGDWVGHELGGLDSAQIQHMLACEHGGMNEAMVNLYGLTKNKKYLDYSYFFQHRAVLDPLAVGKDPLPGKHSNTQIPKIIGCARRYELTGNPADAAVARNFWDIMVHHHTYVIGGNSDHEYLEAADHLNDFLSESTCETCNTYNMLKLTRHLFSWNPDSHLADYYERALYNDILASQNPENAMMCYFVPLRMGTKKVFSDSTETFTCCVGSGMENHSKYGEGIYYEGADGSLYVNLFIPSVLHWHERSIQVTQVTRYPYSDTVEISFSGSADFPLRIRHPAWATHMEVSVNGVDQPGGDGYVTLHRRWKSGDRVRVVLPMHLYTEGLPDNASRVALLYGPLVLAGQVAGRDSVPVLLTSDRNPSDWIHQTGALTFETTVGKPNDVTFSPFFTTYDHYYSVYWDYFTPEQWTLRQAEYEAERRRRQDIEARTVDVMRLGEMQPERDHHLVSEQSYASDDEERASRECRNGGYFAFDLKPSDSLLVTAWGGDNGRVADIYVDSVKIATLALHRPKPNQTIELVYAMPAGGRITFRTPKGRSSGAIFEVRTLRRTDYPILPVPFTAVHVDDNFWAPKLEVNREVTIPYVLRMCREHGRLNNFVAAAKRNGAKLTTYPFDDTDVYKAIEGASYSLQVKRDTGLEHYLDTLITLIGSAQEPDGYLYTFRTANEAHPHEWIGTRRWQNEEVLSHELYNAGHLYEAAVAHYQATGKRTLLDIALKNADLLVTTFGYGKEVKYPGHQVVEMGLAKLYRVTGERKYLDLAQFFLDVRHGGESYNQADKPILAQDSAEGHAVRAGYMYSGIADVAALTGNKPYEEVIDSIWTDVVNDKLYITGGIGATGDGEAFGGPYELPNMSAYAETCAAVANIFWNNRMFLLHGDAKYIDVLERTLYNGLLSGVSLNGTRFFYPNPLASMGQHQRSAWFDCACCISNMARFLPSMPGYIFAKSGNDLYVNLFVGCTADVPLTSGTMGVRLRTEYPWDGHVALTLTPSAPFTATLRIRIPGWVEGHPMASNLYYETQWPSTITVEVNGQAVPCERQQGYAVLTRRWASGDVVSLNFPMEVEHVTANAQVTDDQGRFAFQRGPIVYCLEGPDNKDSLVRDLMVDTASAVSVTRASVLGGIEELRVPAFALKRSGGDTLQTTVMAVAIPYYAWANRGPSEMTVWIPYERSASTPAPPATIASRSRITSSIGTPRMLKSINDQYDPKNSDDHSMPYFHWWPRKNTTEYVEYDFDGDHSVSSSQVYWFDDGPWGGCRTPASWRILYLAGDQWIPVHNSSPYEVAKDRYCGVTFDPVTTRALRLEVQLPADYSTGIHEWRVE